MKLNNLMGVRGFNRKKGTTHPKILGIICGDMKNLLFITFLFYITIYGITLIIILQIIY